MLDLTSVRAKLVRAQEHAQTVKNEVRAWMDRSPYSLVEQVNAGYTRYSLILRVNEPAPFLRWSLIIADCLSDLRASLDHLVYTIARQESSPNLPRYEGDITFPITDCRKKFDRAVERHKLGDISDTMRAAIEAMQPYNRPHPELPPLLSVLRDLNNSDKHKLLRLAYGAVYTGSIGFTGDVPEDGRIWREVRHSGEVKDGTEIFAMVCTHPSPDMHYDRTIFQIIVVMGHRKRDPFGHEGSDRTEFAALLTHMMTEVREVIYNIDKKFMSG